jgi:hypothetical protein
MELDLELTGHHSINEQGTLSMLTTISEMGTKENLLYSFLHVEELRQNK